MWSKHEKTVWLKITTIKLEQVNKKNLFYEAVFQIGNKDDMNVRGEHGGFAKQILDEFMQDFQKGI